MDFTALRYFSATAHSRSIRAASDRLHVSPSAISRQIAKLEHELRTPIFDRRAQGMKLTPAGEVLLSKIDGVMREFSGSSRTSPRCRTCRPAMSTSTVSRPPSRVLWCRSSTAFMHNIRM